MSFLTLKNKYPLFSKEPAERRHSRLVRSQLWALACAPGWAFCSCHKWIPEGSLPAEPVITGSAGIAAGGGPSGRPLGFQTRQKWVNPHPHLEPVLWPQNHQMPAVTDLSPLASEPRPLSNLCPPCPPLTSLPCPELGIRPLSG